MKRILFLLLVSFYTVNSFAQKDSTLLKPKKDSAKIQFSGYVDAYYAHYTDDITAGSYQKFPSVCPREGFGLNTAMLSASYDAEKVHGIVSLQFGDIARSAWSGTYNNIMEAHAGVRLAKKLWLDGGFFRTHFGTEGLLPKENIASSVSVCTWYEPYFESGFRLNYNPSNKLAINLFVLNGYNMYEDNNHKKSFGMLVTYALGEKGNIGYSNYIGDDTPTSGDTLAHKRIHNNLFFNYEIKKIKIQIGGDYCFQENGDTLGSGNASMYSGVASLKYQICKKFAVYGRGEIFHDPQGFMSAPPFRDKTGKLTGLILWGVTDGMEYKPTDNSYIKLEMRTLQMNPNQEIFSWNNKKVNNRMEILFHFGVSF